MKKHGLDETKYTLIEHLSELRSRITRSFLAVLVTTVAAFVYAPEILEYATQPLKRILEDRNRIETLLVYRDGAEGERLAAHLDKSSHVRFQGRIATLGDVPREVAAAHERKRPLDLILVATHTLDADGTLISDLLEAVDPAPFVAYLVADPADPVVGDLQLEGALVIRDPPKPAVLNRIVRRAAGAAGKSAAQDKLVVLSPLDVFFAYLKIALVVGLFAACPIWLYQGWRFIAPGLYNREKRLVLPSVLSASALFIGGGLFAYYAMFPVMFDFLVNQMMPANLQGSFTVDKYLGLLLTMTVAFGVVFELPLVLAMMASAGIVSAEQLKKFRKYAVVLAFVLGALLTPADPISQSMMAVPLVVFYELGIVLAGVMARRRKQAEAEGLAEEESTALEKVG